MIKSALEYILSLDKKEVFEIDGKKFTYDKPFKICEDTIDRSLKIRTLQGIVDYLEALPDPIHHADMILHIEDFNKVSLITNLNKDLNRNVILESNAVTPFLKLNDFLTQESFLIMLQSCFVDNEDKLKILKVVGTMRDTTVKEFGDDGISQSVVAKVNIGRVADVKIPNPCILKPYRTFQEIDQPESKFILRMKEGGQVGLFEADGGAWKNQAVKNIRDWFNDERIDITYIS